MRRTIFSRTPQVAAAGVAVATLMTVTGAQAAIADTAVGGEPSPITIPAVQQWTGADGSFHATAQTRVVVPTDDAEELAEAAQLFAGDLASLGLGHEIAVTDEQPQEHDIVIRLDAVGVTDEEGYRLEVAPATTIVGANATGAFYGTRTLLQLLQQDTAVPAGVAVDSPGYEERGLMVDLGRMTLDYDWLADTVRDMSYLKLNTLHLHLTDTEGWRVESDYVTETEGYLTKDELRDLVDLAERYHVTIVPEIDLPSHQGQLLADYPQYQLASPDGPVCDPEDIENCTADGNKIGRLDYSIPEAQELLENIIAEYIDIFPGPYWHLGADEYLGSQDYEPYPQLLAYAQEHIGPDATANDGYIYFINDMNDFVKSHGKQARMWNDVVAPGTNPQVDTDIIIDWWTDVDSSDIVGSVTNGGPYVPYSPQELLDRGYTVLNSSFLPTYTSPPGGHTASPTYECLYSTFDVEEFFGYLYVDDTKTGGECGPMLGGYGTVAKGSPGLLGARVTMWNSTQPGVPPWTPEEGAADIMPRLRAMAQRTWDSPEIAADIDAFQGMIDAVGTNPAPALALGSERWDVSADGGETVVSVSSTLAIQATADADWLRVDSVPGGVGLTAAAHTGDEARSAVVTVTAAGEEQTILVGQEAAPAEELTPQPSAEPSAEPTAKPTAEPTVAPTAEPTDDPSEDDGDPAGEDPAQAETATAVPSPGGDGGLAPTGGDVAWPGIVAASALVAAGIAMIVRRRQRA